MGRYVGPICRLCRRAGEKLFLKGERCFSPKCAVERRGSAPGEHVRRRRRLSERGVQLREKQKAKQIYGVLERQFRGYYEEALKHKGVTGQNLMQLLERRLDNAVFRMGFADSRRQARQMVGHGRFKVNAKRMNVPSFLVSPGDVIIWKQAGETPESLETLKENIRGKAAPGWLGIDANALQGKVLALPQTGDIDTKIQDRLIIDYYSR